MKIRISTIPAEGLKIRETIPLQSINDRMSEGRDNDIVFTEAPVVELTVYKTHSGAETVGTVRATYLQPCGRCLEGVAVPLEVATNLLLAPIPEKNDQDQEGPYEDDIGISYYEGDHVDLTPLVQEALILKLSRFFKPALKPDGSCSQCGRTVNEVTNVIEGPATKVTFGELLEKAGKKSKAS